MGININISFNTDDLRQSDLDILKAFTGESTPDPAPAPAEKKAEEAPAKKPAAAKKAAPKPEPVEEPEDDDEPTMAKAIARATALVNDDRAEEVKKALVDLGVKKVGQLDEDQIAEFLDALAD